jgi:hypothetical protein
MRRVSSVQALMGRSTSGNGVKGSFIFCLGEKNCYVGFFECLYVFEYTKKANLLNSGKYFRESGLPEIALDHIFVDFDYGSRFFRLRQFFFWILGLDL